MSDIKNTYLQYGVPSDKAAILSDKGLPVSTFKTTSKKILISKYDLNKVDVDFIKNCLKRKPIESDLINILLERSNYVCCLCKGQKSDAFIIHHIKEYSTSQDNSYDNLAVLCPNDHDLAHKEGRSLTHKITKDQILSAKCKWEKEVEKNNCDAASKKGDIDTTFIDFINIPRVSELALQLFKKLPETEHSSFLKTKQILKPDGSFDTEYVQSNLSGGHYLFDYMNCGESLHFLSIFKKILQRIEFVNLEDYLSVRGVTKPGFIGTYCYYVGGLYGKSPKLPITNETPPTHLYFKRKRFFVEWKINSLYLFSSTSIWRLSERNIYIVYGVVRNVQENNINNKTYLHIDIRPLLVAAPIKSINRTPLIHYIKEHEDVCEASAEY